MKPIAHKKTITGPIVQAPNIIASYNDLLIAITFFIIILTGLRTLLETLKDKICSHLALYQHSCQTIFQTLDLFSTML